MLGRTHFLSGLVLGLPLFIALEKPFSLDITVFLLFLLGSLFPDIDESKSFLGRYVPLLSRIFKHRGFFHSVFSLLIFSFLFSIIFNRFLVGVAFAAGFLLHLLQDILTKKGVELYPFRICLRGPFAVGGLFENVLFVLLSIFLALELFVIML